MENFYFNELVALRQQERNTLQCVRVVDKNRTELKDVVYYLGGKICGGSLCPIVLFPAYKRTRCIKCRQPPSYQTNMSNTFTPTSPQKSLSELVEERNRETTKLMVDQIKHEERMKNLKEIEERKQLQDFSR